MLCTYVLLCPLNFFVSESHGEGAQSVGKGYEKITEGLCHVCFHFCIEKERK